MRFAAHAEHRAMHSRHHGRSAVPVLGGLKRLASVPLSLPTGLCRRRSTGVMARRGSRWPCLVGAGAAGTLLLSWSFDPARMRHCIGHSVVAGLGAAAPLLQFG